MIVREFYANFMEAQDQNVFVRGVLVDAFPITIEAFHRTPSYSPNFYEKLNEHEVDYNAIIIFLTKSQCARVQRAGTNDPMRFQQSITVPEAKMWIYFISSKLLLVQHITDVTRHRAIMLHAIL